MRRVAAAFGILYIVILSLAAPAFAESVDQAGWNARKQSIMLPNRVRLAYAELGNRDGPPLLLLHGWTDSSRAWTIVAPHLTDHRLLIPDQRGHGASAAPDCCYATADFVHDAILFLDAKGIERVDVVGHSLGSIIAQRLAAEHPQRVGKLVLIGSTALPPVERGDWLWREVMAFEPPLDPRLPFLRQWSAAASPTPVDADYVEHADAEAAAVPLVVWKSVLRELADVPAGRFAANIAAPTLILSGGKDSLFPPEHHRALAALMPGAKAHIFPELGHNLIVERPHEVGPVIAAFGAATETEPAMP